MDINTWHGRLTHAREAKGISKTDFAKMISVSNPTITEWENGETKSLKAKNLVKICDVLKIRSEWLLDGKGEMTSGVRISDGLPSASKNEITITQYSDVSGSMGGGVLLRDQPGEIQQWSVTPEWITKNVRNHSGVKNLSIVTGFGNSMRGMFNPGDPILIDTGVSIVEFDAVYFFRVGNEGFIKTLQRVPGVGLRVISANKEFETWTITKDMDFEVFGRVIKVWESMDL